MITYLAKLSLLGIPIFTIKITSCSYIFVHILNYFSKLDSLIWKWIHASDFDKFPLQKVCTNLDSEQQCVKVNISLNPNIWGLLFLSSG